MKKLFYLAIITLLMAGICSLATAADVVLGAGDVLKISVFGNPDLGLETKISEAGNITYPLLGEIVVSGLSTSMAEKKIASLLESGGFLKKAQVNIIVSLLQSQQVSVLGQVNRPGRYPIDGRRSLTDILAVAGGVNSEGGETVTIIRTRNGKIMRDSIDLLEIFREGEAKENIEIISGDVVFVERASKFYIYGEVQRPGVYRLERNMTVIQALSAGGGLNQRGTERGVRIKRRDAVGVLQEIEAKHTDTLLADDVVYVRESLF